LLWWIELIALVYSLIDPASRGIAERLREAADARRIEPPPRSVEAWRISEDVVLVGFPDDVIHLSYLDQSLPDAQRFVVLSRHSSASRIPVLSVHTPGNPGPEALYGGRPWELPPSDPLMGWLLLRGLKRFAQEAGIDGVYEVVYESTHHGPTEVSKPITFIEIGSDEERWRDVVAQRVVAQSVLSALSELDRARCVATTAFGGTHYQRVLTRRALESDMCFGHMITKNVLNSLDEAGLRRVAELAIERTVGVEQVYIEKLRSGIRRVIEEVAEARGLRVVRA